MLKLIPFAVNPLRGVSTNLNTSHVKVNQSGLRLQTSGLAYLNTSHVKVNRGRFAFGTVPDKIFKYISC